MCPDYQYITIVNVHTITLGMLEFFCFSISARGSSCFAESFFAVSKGLVHIRPFT